MRISFTGTKEAIDHTHNITFDFDSCEMQL